MQRNCHEFIAYENLIGNRRGNRDGRGPTGPIGSAGIDSVVPLVRRALKVLSDREVTPQLGLLKSTLLQLDSTFSERTYGSTSFRDFADKLASAGVVTLKEAGRNVLVELRENGHHAAPSPEARTEEARPSEPRHHEPRHHEPRQGGEQRHPEPRPQGQQAAPRAEEAVAEVKRLFAIGQTPPRWPMYLRQVKQYLRNVDSSFDERKFGFNSLNDLLRACQREGLFRMERDRQGVIRFFQGTAMKEAGASAAARGINQADIEAAERLAAQAEAELAAAEAREAEVVDGDVVRDSETPAIVDAEAVSVEEAATDDVEPASDEEPAKPARRRSAKGARSAKEPKAAKERKTAAKPRSSSRKKSSATAEA
jgi:hypothetical protein